VQSAYKGVFVPKNPQKYKGDATNIIFRSLLERSYMTRLDNDPRIVEWASEEIIVPYISPVDGAPHRYFPDFYVKLLKDGVVNEYLVEIKPKSQTLAPKPPKSGKISRSYKMARIAWAVNEAKWNAARNYCKDKGLTFEILTEEDAGIKRIYNKQSLGKLPKGTIKTKAPWKSTWSKRK